MRKYIRKFQKSPNNNNIKRKKYGSSRKKREVLYMKNPKNIDITFESEKVSIEDDDKKKKEKWKKKYIRNDFFHRRLLEVNILVF